MRAFINAAARRLTMATTPFPLSDVEPELEALRQYWASLIRGHNDMPFADDFAPSAVPQLSERLIVLDVFDKPNRFRYSSLLGKDLERHYGEEVRDLFVHEAARRAPFDNLEAQAEATVEGAKPTYYRAGHYSRILLPMWGDGRIAMLVGAVLWR
jgi:hypothetical protein